MFFKIQQNGQTGIPKVSESGNGKGFFCQILADDKIFIRLYGDSRDSTLKTARQVVDILKANEDKI